MHINELRYWIVEQLELKPFDWNEKTVVWTDGYYYVAVNSLKDPSYISVWTEDNKKIGALVSDPTRLMKEPWKKVRDVSVNPKHQGNRLALRMYQVLLQTMPREFAGLAGYEPDIISKRIIQIYKRLGAEEVGDYWFVRNPNRVNEELYNQFQNKRMTMKHGHTWLYDVLKNPSMKELVELNIKKYGDVRGFLAGKDFLAWNTSDALHAEVAESLGDVSKAIPVVLSVSGGDAFVYVTDFSRRTIWHENRNVANVIKNHPYFKRMFNEVDVDYYNGDIVGNWEDIHA